MSLTLGVLLVLHLAAAGFLASRDGGRYGHVLTFYLVGFVGFYLVRPAVLAVGLDSPIAGALDRASFTHDLENGLAYLLAWQLLVATGVVLTRGMRAPRAAIGSPPRDLTTRWGVPTLAFLALASTLVVVFLSTQAGGLGNTIVAAKFDKSFAGLFFLQYIPIAGSLLAAQLAVGATNRRSQLFHWAASMGFALCVFAWGSRRVVVVVLAIFVVHQAVGSRPSRRFRPRRLNPRRAITFSLAGAALAAVAALSLRIIRDRTLGGMSATMTSDQPLVRQVSLAMNSSYFEAFVLATRDFPERYPFWGLAPFVNGTAGMVPRLLWPGKPEGVAIGADFRQLYEPSTVNGWPLGGAGEWYVGFGFVGLAVGALLTGALIGVIGRRMATHGSLPYAAAFGLQVMELGVGGQTPLRWVGWILPASLLTVAFISTAGRDRRRVGRRATPMAAGAVSP